MQPYFDPIRKMTSTKMENDIRKKLFKRKMNSTTKLNWKKTSNQMEDDLKK
jgi:hypothetical protein